MGINQLYTLLKKYREQKCTPEEWQLLNEWYEQFDGEAESIPCIPDAKLEELYFRIENKLKVQKKGSRRSWQILRYTFKIAAVLTVFAGIGYYFFTVTDIAKEEIVEQKIAGIRPGQRQAELVFGDGTKMVLDSSIRILKDNNGQIIKQGIKPVLDYTLAKNDARQEVFNTITVPLGGEYGVILADGTEVWLNAGSTLKYPVTFAKDKRVVSLSGEAFFKVTKSAVPFIVKTFDIDVQVLGTSFNVSAYGNDDCVMTTLVCGSVLVSSNHDDKQIRMEPGHILSYTRSTDDMSMEKCDPDLYTSWINGEFKFRDMRLEDIMKKVNRWYNCKIRFEDVALRELRFSGAAERDRPVEYLLNMIKEVTDVNFEVDQETIILKK